MIGATLSVEPRGQRSCQSGLVGKLTDELGVDVDDLAVPEATLIVKDHPQNQCDGLGIRKILVGR